MLAVGGAGYDAGFRGAASSSNIDRFVQNLVGLVNQYGYDGVDIDWEPILSTDQAAVQSLVYKLRAALPAGSLITADVGWLSLNFPLSSADAQFYKNLAASLDQMNIMTYGMADNWSGWVSWHSSAVYGAAGNHPSSTEVSVNGYRNAGVPAAKLGLGIGFYGSCWNSPVTGPLQAPGSSHVIASDNSMSYANIIAQYYSAGAYRYDSTAQAPYLSFASPTGPQGCTFVSYEDETSVAAKGQYASNIGLGGAIIWNINQGYQPGAANPNALLAAVGRAFPGAPVSGPTAAFAYSVSNRTVSFVDQSTDTGGTIVVWSWTFGDGATSSAQHPSHAYARDGSYAVALTVTDSAGLSASTSKTVAVQTLPAAPTGLSASAASSTRVNLAWTDNADNETGYKIERSVSGGSFSQIATAGANATSYGDTAVSEGRDLHVPCAFVQRRGGFRLLEHRDGHHARQPAGSAGESQRQGRVRQPDQPVLERSLEQRARLLRGTLGERQQLDQGCDCRCECGQLLRQGIGGEPYLLLSGPGLQQRGQFALLQHRVSHNQETVTHEQPAPATAHRCRPDDHCAPQGERSGD